MDPTANSELPATLEIKPRGRPFKKGVSGNPTGRPKTPETIKEAFASKTPEAIEALFAIVKSKTVKTADRLKAIQLLLSYSLGQPVQSTKLEANINSTTTHFDPEALAKLSDAELEQLVALQEKLITPEVE